MDKLKFIQAITRLRVLETRLLDRIKLERIIDSPNAESALKILFDNNYGGQVSGVQKPEDYELLLGEELKALYQLMYEITPEKSLIDLLSVRYDYHNMKVLLKAKALNKQLDYLLAPNSIVPAETLKECIQTENYKLLSEIMKEAIETTESVYKKSIDPQDIDVVLDRYLYKDMIQRAQLIGDAYAIDYLKTTIDFINIKTFIRIRKQKKERQFLSEVLLEGGSIECSVFLGLMSDPVENLVVKLAYTKYHNILKEGFEEYAKSKKVNTLEKLMDNYLMDYIKQGKYVSFGIEPLFSYLLAKETEIRNVRIIMVGKINNIAPTVIRERLRDIYV